MRFEGNNYLELIDLANLTIQIISLNIYKVEIIGDVRLTPGT
jgi:hypothetical protein